MSVFNALYKWTKPLAFNAMARLETPLGERWRQAIVEVRGADEYKRKR
jgi:hypothetical protein